MYRRLCVYDEPTHEHSKRDKQELQIFLHHSLTENVAERRKAYVYACEEEHQSDICINYSDNYLNKRAFFQLQGENLEQQEENEYRQKRDGNLSEICLLYTSRCV